VARISQRQAGEGDARVSLLTARRDDADVVTGVGHATGLMGHHAFDATDNGGC
jgi:hypothetical protein